MSEEFKIGDYVYNIEKADLDKNGYPCVFNQNAHYFRFLFKRYLVNMKKGDILFCVNAGIPFEIHTQFASILDSVRSLHYCGIFSLKLASFAGDVFKNADPEANNLWLEVYFNRSTGKLGLTLDSVKDEMSE